MKLDRENCGEGEFLFVCKGCGNGPNAADGGKVGARVLARDLDDLKFAVHIGVADGYGEGVDGAVVENSILFFGDDCDFLV